jgi:Pin2-interacting protein X1
MTMATPDDAPAVPLVGKKYMAKLGAMVNESAASEMSSFARRHMEKMGWSEGKGLGKEEQGMATYVRVKKREEAMGIGVETLKVEEQQNQWWYNAYDKLANKIKIAMDSDDDDVAAKKAKKKLKKESKKKSKKSKKRARGSDSSSDDDEDAAASENKKFRVPTDEELFAATGGKLFGRRAYGSCNGKLKREALLIQGKMRAGETSTSTASVSSVEEQNESEKKKRDKKSKKKKKQKTQAADDEDP